MKLAMVIVCLAAIAAGVVHFRREGTHLRNEVQRLQSQQVALKRDLWDQQVRRRAQDLALPMVDRAQLYQGPAAPTAGAAPRSVRGGRSSTVHD
jgi:hypothetical protein